LCFHLAALERIIKIFQTKYIDFTVLKESYRRDFEKIIRDLDMTALRLRLGNNVSITEEKIKYLEMEDSYAEKNLIYWFVFAFLFAFRVCIEK
jgi:hypothetical protein